MPTIVVEVMPKDELLDPQGKAVAGALARSGTSRFAGVRIGKRFELTFEGPADDAALAEAQELAATLLSNSVIENVVSVTFAGEWRAYRPLAGSPAVDSLSSGAADATVADSLAAEIPVIGAADDSLATSLATETPVIGAKH